jgi:hypothetical protein
MLHTQLSFHSHTIRLMWQCPQVIESDVGQEFHLVPKMILLLRGLVLTSRLLTNMLFQEQSYCRTKSFTSGFSASGDENVLLSKPNIRF